MLWPGGVKMTRLISGPRGGDRDTGIGPPEPEGETAADALESKRRDDDGLGEDVDARLDELRLLLVVMVLEPGVPE